MHLSCCFLQMNFFMASEIAQRHVTEIVERDNWEMHRLLSAAQKVKEGIRNILYTVWLMYPLNLDFAGRLSASWTIFNEYIFIVRFSVLLLLNIKTNRHLNKDLCTINYHRFPSSKLLMIQGRNSQVFILSCGPPFTISFTLFNWTFVIVADPKQWSKWW